MSCFASLTYSDHDGYYWRTSQQSFIEEQMTYSDHWPKSVCVTTIPTLDGWKVTASQLPPLARHINENGFSYWPTPTCRDYKDTGKWTSLARFVDKKRLACSLAAIEKVSGQMNPAFPEFLMGFPIGWTDLKQLETPSFPRSLNTSDQR